jgi:Nup85 Nucleoporin
MALEVLARLDDAGTMQKKAAELLEKLPLDTIDQMDKAVLLCTDLGLESEGRRVCEKYGDHITSSSENYGVALICYARARCTRKLKSVIELLTSYSLVQSRAFPETGKLDEQLRALLKDPRTCLSAIAAVNAEAAHMLQFYFSGYASLRRFYETRDEPNGLQPRARKRAAAQALTAVIRSSADGIYGGLYDPDRDPAVQVDGLLALLGEALEFINGRIFLITA